jgi:hypothetical protein
MVWRGVWGMEEGTGEYSQNTEWRTLCSPLVSLGSKQPQAVLHACLSVVLKGNLCIKFTLGPWRQP